METTKEEYEFCRRILDNYDRYNGILKSGQGCSHDRSKEKELYERSTRDKLDAIRLFCDVSFLFLAKCMSVFVCGMKRRRMRRS